MDQPTQEDATPNAPREPDDGVLTGEDEQRIAEVKSGGQSELRRELETAFSGPDWPPLNEILEPFRRYAIKVFDVNAAVHRQPFTKRGENPQDALKLLVQITLTDIFGSECESLPSGTSIDWIRRIWEMNGMEVVETPNNPDPNCLYHKLMSDAIQYRDRFHPDPQGPFLGNPTPISLYGLKGREYLLLRERHYVAMTIKPYLEDRITERNSIEIPAPKGDAPRQSPIAAVPKSESAASRILTAAMKRSGLNPPRLAMLVRSVLAKKPGKKPKVDRTTIYRIVSGQTRRPDPAIRNALIKVLGLPEEQAEVVSRELSHSKPGNPPQKSSSF